MPRQDNHYINLSLHVFGQRVLRRAIRHLQTHAIKDDRALWELNYAHNRVAVDVTFHRTRLAQDGPRRYERRDDYKKSAKNA